MKATCLSILLFIVFINESSAQSNLCAQFNGADHLKINAPGLSNPKIFTIEFWINISPMGAGTSATIFELEDLVVQNVNLQLQISEIGGSITIRPNFSGTLSVPVTILPGWHHIALASNGVDLTMFIDGIAGLPDNSASWVDFDLSNIHFGSNVNGTSPFSGAIDEIRVWDRERTSIEIANSFHCVCRPDESNLLFWTSCDNNNANNQVTGSSLASSSFGLTYSNCGNPLFYPNYQDAQIQFYNVGSPLMAITELCSGKPALIKLMMPDGQVADDPSILVPGSNLMATTSWEQSVDGGASWANVPFPTNGYAFPIAPGAIEANCSTNPSGYLIIKYRVKLELSDPSGAICTYYTQNSDLKVCCPISPISIDFISNDADNLFCKGDAVNFQFNVQNADPFLSSPDISIEWFVNGISYASNVSSINYSGTISSSQLCIKVVVHHCSCSVEEEVYCIDFDPTPQCNGVIQVVPSPNVFQLGPDSYEICPGYAAQLTYAPANSFPDGIVQWEYAWSGGGPWYSLGSSNTIQNTNILPQLSLPNPLISPYLWPTGQNCIYYRISNKPINDPSACLPCTSSAIKICLRTGSNTFAITGNNMICEGQSSLLSVSPTVAGAIYNWYYNGNLVNSGINYNATQDGNYWVEAIFPNSCSLSVSTIFNLQVCKIVPVINCPPCFQVGRLVNLSACNSTDRCNKPLSYNWQVNNGPPASGTGCNFIHLTPAAGASYSVTVTNSMGCSASTSVFIKPCTN